MGMRATKEEISRYVRKIVKRFGNMKHRVIYASNGETAVLWWNGKDWVLSPEDAAKELGK